MKQGLQQRVTDPILVCCVMVAAFAEMGIREMYHRAGSETGMAVALAFVWLLVGIARVLTARWMTSFASRWRVSRILAVVGTLAAANTILGLLVLVQAADLFVRNAVISTGVAVVLLALAMPEPWWGRVRPVMAVFALLFVLSQPVIAMLRSGEQFWPDASRVEPVADGAPRVATLALLLDELNAQEAPKFERALAAHQFAVASKSIRPVDGNTQQVVPAMFSGKRFHDAKACSPTAVCASADVLDYSKLRASREDIDVVGFFQPYCSIRGLRYCKRIGFEADVLRFDRWRCAIWRRTGMPLGVTPEDCAAVFNVSYESLRASIQRAIFEAPVFSKGGMLYAHIPLPHPPGRAVDASLKEHYRDNVERAVELVDEMVTRLERAGIPSRVVIFSDHPLRAKNWCSKHIPYVERGCVVTPEMTSTHVPLIVGASADGGKLPNIADIQDNDQVFPFIAQW